MLHNPVITNRTVNGNNHCWSGKKTREGGEEMKWLGRCGHAGKAQKSRALSAPSPQHRQTHPCSNYTVSIFKGQESVRLKYWLAQWQPKHKQEFQTEFWNLKNIVNGNTVRLGPSLVSDAIFLSLGERRQKGKLIKNISFSDRMKNSLFRNKALHGTKKWTQSDAIAETHFRVLFTQELS